MDTLWQDIRFGARMLIRNRGFAVVAALTLALGISANSAIFSVVDALLLRPLPFPDPDRLVNIWRTDANRGIIHGMTSAPEFLEWREQAKSFEEIAGWKTSFRSVRGAEHPEQVWGGEVSSEFLRMLGVRPYLGRDFIPDDETPGHGQVALISYGLWQREFGGDPGWIGRTIEVNDKPCTVIGVLPYGFSPVGTSVAWDLWTPYTFDRNHMDRDASTLIVFGRLKPGMTMARAQAEMETITQDQKRAFPGINQNLGVTVVSMHDSLEQKYKPELQVLLVAVGVVLLIACVNVASLLLARSATREREIAVRTALGARRTRVVRQLLTESVILGLAGGLLGIVMAYGGVELLRMGLPPHGSRGEIPHADWIAINGSVVAYTFLVSLVTGVLFGLFPAVQMSFSELGETLKEGGRGSIGGHRGGMMRSGLIVAEVALSIVLLIGAGLLIRSFVRMLTEHLGLDSHNVLTMQVWLPESHYADGTPVANFFQQAIERVAALPGVASASAVNFVPLSGWRADLDFDIEGRATPRQGEEFTAQYTVADANYFRTMRIPLEAGREFASTDGDQTRGVAIINESLEHRYWPNENPIGQQMRLHFDPQQTPWQPAAKDAWITIVGIVGDVRDWNAGGKTPPIVYLPYLQAPSHLMCLVIRTTTPPLGLVPSVRDAIWSLDKNQPVAEVKTMEDLLDAAVSQRRLSMFLLSAFAAFATFLAAVGIYGLMSYGVAQRSHEIGIRMALGAERRDIVKLIMSQGVRLTMLGAVIGGGVSFAAMRWIASELYGVRGSDPATLVSVIAFLLIVALIACYVPARRATKVDPMIALRYE
jgi:putative ABC transport system permease protein